MFLYAVFALCLERGEERCNGMKPTSATMPAQKPAYTSPYHVFCREQRPLLPAGTKLKNSDREKAMGQMWKELSQAERAAYEQGLTQLACSGRGGLRAWAPALPSKLPAPPSAAISATFLAGRAAANSVAVPVLASVSQLEGTYQTFVTQGGQPCKPMAQQTGEEGGVGGGGASEGELERGRHAPEGGYSDGDLDRILQEQLDRLRSSWSHER